MGQISIPHLIILFITLFIGSCNDSTSSSFFSNRLPSFSHIELACYFLEGSTAEFMAEIYAFLTGQLFIVPSASFAVLIITSRVAWPKIAAVPGCYCHRFFLWAGKGIMVSDFKDPEIPPDTKRSA